jgi:GT2 family glycosyltransferase
MKLQAVLVLYQQSAADSIAFQTLTQALTSNTELRDCIDIFLYDNSPVAQPVPSMPRLKLSYQHDISNGGLAAAYKSALQHALAVGNSWLLLLDQDTQLSADFLSVLLTAITQLEENQQIVAVVPKLAFQGKILSPFQLTTFGQRTLSMNFEGVSLHPITAFNSGATFRVDFLKFIDNFDSAFWLDYLDYWLFYTVAASGKAVFVLPIQLQHALSLVDRKQYMSHFRYQNYLSAEAAFTRKYRSRLTYAMLPVRWMARVVKHIFLRRDSWYAKETIRHALCEAICLMKSSFRISADSDQ